MRKHRAFIFATSGVAAAAIAAACVGDDPTSSGTTTPEGGSSPDAASPDTALPLGDGGGTADTGVDATKRHCETLVKPAAPTEFFCADFDGPDASEGWTNTFRVDGGIFGLTTAAAVSLPQALEVKPPPGVIGNGTGPALQWASVGGKNFVQAELRARMNPANSGGLASYTGEIKLLEITTTNALAAFYYTQGANLTAESNYVGYYIKLAGFGGAAEQTDFPVTTPLSTAVWTDVKLTFFASGRVTLTYNGISILDQTKYPSMDTSVTYSVGAAASGDVNEPKAMRYDNVELTLVREQ
jgi:hypothetical protein